MEGNNMKDNSLTISVEEKNAASKDATRQRAFMALSNGICALSTDFAQAIGPAECAELEELLTGTYRRLFEARTRLAAAPPAEASALELHQAAGKEYDQARTSLREAEEAFWQNLARDASGEDEKAFAEVWKAYQEALAQAEGPKAEWNLARCPSSGPVFLKMNEALMAAGKLAQLLNKKQEPLRAKLAVCLDSKNLRQGLSVAENKASAARLSYDTAHKNTIAAQSECDQSEVSVDALIDSLGKRFVSEFASITVRLSQQLVTATISMKAIVGVIGQSKTSLTSDQATTGEDFDRGGGEHH
jgi:hypothetical protein